MANGPNIPQTASSNTTPWGDTPANLHIPQYTPINKVEFPSPDTFLRNVSNLFHPQPPTSLPFNAEQLRGQSLIANATGKMRDLFKPITQVFHSPRNENTVGNP
jgi:hypothetical protein